MGVIRGLVRLAALAFLMVLGAVIWAEQRALSRHAPGVVEGLPVDAVIVLGGGMDFDLMLNGLGRERVRTGLAVLDAGQARAVIFTGALGETPLTSEAALMHAFALALGADPARLRLEPQARTTLQNLLFSFRIAEEEGWTRLAIVTDAFHLTRAGALAGLLGRPDVVLVASDGLTKDRLSTRATLILREALAWPLNAAKAAGWIVLGWIGWTEAERGALIV